MSFSVTATTRLFNRSTVYLLSHIKGALIVQTENVFVECRKVQAHILHKYL